METLDKNLIALLALELDLKTLSSLCLLSKRFNLNICQSNSFWINKLKKDFNIIFNEIPYKQKSKLYYIYIANQLRKDKDDFLIKSSKNREYFK